MLLLSAEDSPRDTIRPRADWAGADVNKIDIVECSKDNKGRIRLFNLSKDIHTNIGEMLGFRAEDVSEISENGLKC